MKKAIVLMGVLLALPSFAAAEDWSNVSMIDSQCATKAKANPDSHTRSCALACAKSGFGIIDKDGNYLKFDAKEMKKRRNCWRATTRRTTSGWMCRGRRKAA